MYLECVELQDIRFSISLRTSVRNEILLNNNHLIKYILHGYVNIYADFIAMISFVYETETTREMYWKVSGTSMHT